MEDSTSLAVSLLNQAIEILRTGKKQTDGLTVMSLSQHREKTAPATHLETTLCLLFQVALIILYGTLVEYDIDADGTSKDQTAGTDAIVGYYPMFQDIHVMMFIGFGFLMTFLRKYAYSAVGFTMMVAALVIQWSILVLGFWHRVFDEHESFHHPIKLNMLALINADFAAAAVLISFGGILGKVTPVELVIIVFFEVIGYGLNESIGVILLKANDIGGSMFIHTYGAYFGLALSFLLGSKRASGHPEAKPNYDHDIFSMIGTVFLWLYWPSFNAGPAKGNAQHRTVINTVLSLCCSCFCTFFYSRYFRHGGKFEMVDIQNATLAGGVAIGASADMVLHPFGAMIIGSIAGMLSTTGFIFVQPFLEKRIGLHDTCGINNLHGMPGILGGIAAAIAAASAGHDEYGDNLEVVFPAGRDPSTQGGYQGAALVVSLGIGLGFGLFTGLVLLAFRRYLRPEIKELALFSDHADWAVPDDFIISATARKASSSGSSAPPALDGITMESAPRVRSETDGIYAGHMTTV
eukprot:TRINITY_DN2445_c0_g1::TRINITY_DN2445_c0_g1_i1::g.9004::m.9004 TRINITY_DN2445_c0_g1::TRINITY_DN2445_c0_g1_i1::g.9004  ORF type:complete len:535 (+),score=133.21,sp/Q8JI14/RHCL2_DANRE/43.84/5e-119,Ammonium_transp/PF00909.16/6.3e-68,Anoctamin/PF04547.7/0.54,Anoctamin/PF04547.7/2.9e+02 TRINITY_DN2445_c0_g1_i1:43-1605(+)